MATSRHWVLPLLFGVWTLLNPAVSDAAPGDHPPFYKISYQGQQAYLLGSIHIGRDDFYPMAEQIESALEKATALVVEVDIENADVASLLRRYAMSPYSMKQDPDNPSAQRLQQYCDDNKAICKALSGYSHWMQATQLSLMRFKLLGYQPEFGVDQTLVMKNASRPVIELESAEFQFQLLSSFEPQIQWNMLLDAIEIPDSEMLALVSAWRTGDEAELERLITGKIEQDEDKQILEKMLWQRNLTMSQKIAEIMTASANKGPLFIVVGAGHVVGEKGIPVKMEQLFDAKVQNCWQQHCL
ncbi:TraB/GumN family protein [Shewanella sp. AS1]|uniref:TraB/GumN family protein n=1 Tax=Shewanella sp. AS1 TaxID=2907626 RepID=UPI001F1D63AF|nr:TraB/GumN family protein [Shewanella sp. AS1]MCE9679833.1 TraB/GumN family protein [Shewanella sp. AS1]